MTCFCQVWKGRPWCAGSHLQEGPLPCLQPGTHRLTTHQNHLTSPSQDFPPVGERSDDQATAHAPPRETDQKAWWWVDFSFLSKMHWYWSACLHLSSQTWKPSIIFQLLSHQCAKNWCLKWRMFPIRRWCLTPLVVAGENGNKISKTCRRECLAMSFVFVCWQ